MHEFDLVPSDYRSFRKLKKHVNVFLMAYGFVVVLIVASKLMLGNEVSTREGMIKVEQRDKQALLVEQQRFNTLTTSIDVVKKRLEILDGLRAGLPVVGAFKVFDRVLNRGVWLESWDFAREGQWKAAKAETSNTGYFIVVPDSGNNQTQKAWRLDTHMVLTGKALNHSKLAEFVQLLLKQPEIKDVKVEKTGLRHQASTSVVTFTLAITTNNLSLSNN